MDLATTLGAWLPRGYALLMIWNRGADQVSVHTLGHGSTL